MTIVVEPRCRTLAVAVIEPLFTAPKKFVLDSIVDVPIAPSGRFENAHAPAAESASAMIAPPWSSPLLVHNSGFQLIDTTTASGVEDVTCTPSVAHNGMAS